ARNTKAAQRLALQFQQHSVQKIYWAAVQGEVAPSEGEWDDWLRKLPEQARAEIVEPNSPGARRALSYYRVLQSVPGGTLLEISPRTGRMHQIRIQAASRGHSVFGDQLYGPYNWSPKTEWPREAACILIWCMR